MLHVLASVVPLGIFGCPCSGHTQPATTLKRILGNVFCQRSTCSKLIAMPGTRLVGVLHIRNDERKIRDIWCLWSEGLGSVMGGRVASGENKSRMFSHVFRHRRPNYKSRAGENAKLSTTSCERSTNSICPGTIICIPSDFAIIHTHISVSPPGDRSKERVVLATNRSRRF